jgi:hypothetical protein
MCAATQIDHTARRLARMAHNASRARRFSADRAKAKWYANFRMSRFTRRFGH